MSFKFELTGNQAWRFGHIHIPRTAGISIKSFFEQAVGAHRCRRFGSIDEVHELYQMRRGDLDAYVFVAAHVPSWVLGLKLRRAVRFIFTVIREPMERELSAFQYIVAGASEGRFSAVKTFDDYLALMAARPELRNMQTQYLATSQELTGAPPREVLNRFVCERQAYFTVEKLPALQEYLKQVLGVPFLFEHLNSTAVGSSRSIRQNLLLPEQISRLESMISGDLELFSAAQQSGGMYLPDWRFSITDDKDEKSNATLEPGNAVLNRATTVDN